MKSNHHVGDPVQVHGHGEGTVAEIVEARQCYRVSLTTGRTVLVHEVNVAPAKAQALTQKPPKVRDKAKRGPREQEP